MQTKVKFEEWIPEGPAGNFRPDQTNEYSFMLQPDSFGGIGVFAVHDIQAGTALKLFDDSKETVTIIVPKGTVPGKFTRFCIDMGDGTVSRPASFSSIDTVWFLNHSDMPNAAHKDDYSYYAVRDIAAGDEILIDYEAL